MIEIINKMQKLYPKIEAQVLIGDMRAALAKETLDVCEDYVNRKAGTLDEMWILIHSNPDPADRMTVRSKVLLLPEKPPKLLGTICFYVDYRISDVELEWVLPLDIMRPGGSVNEDEGASRIVADGKGLPIYH